MFELFIALRHILANRRGTAFTLLSVGIAVGVIVMSMSLTEGVRMEIVRTTIEVNPHLYVQPKPGEDYIYLYRTIDSRVEAYPGVVALSPRLSAQGAARHRDEVRGVDILGVDPQREEDLMGVQSKVIWGDFQELKYKKKSSFLGYKLAEELDLRPGDRFQLTLKASSVDLKVAGLIRKDTVVDSSLVYLPLETAQDLVGQGDVVTEIGIKLSDWNNAPLVAEELNRSLNYDTRSWQDFSREIARFVSTQSQINMIFYSMIFLISGFVIANTTIMIISRRVREIGILMAMGATPSSIRRIFVLENIFLGIPGGVLGVVLGLILGKLITIYGPSSGVGQARLTLDLRPELFLLGFGFGLTLNLIASLYPAYMASRLDPVEAIASE